MLRALVTTAVVAAASAVPLAAALASPASAASAADPVVVHGLAFPAGAPDGLAVLGCAGLFDRVPEPIATVLSRGDAALGSRSLAYDLAGGNAVGSQDRVASLAATTVAGLSVAAPEGASGVAYAGYQAPADRDSSRVWLGRAEVSAAPGGWQQVDVTGLTYHWTHLDLGTQQPVPAADGDLPAPADATVTDLMASQGGDGQGFYSVGFGCDGRPFRIDALRAGGPAGVTTYDLEGFTSATAGDVSASRVDAGSTVSLTGSVQWDAGAPLGRGLLVLEEQPFGQDGFTPVEGAAAPARAGRLTVTVRPDVRTVYRWRYLGGPSTDGSTSLPVVVDVTPVVSAETSAAADGTTTVVGQVTPSVAGVRVTLWRWSGQARVPAGSVPTDAHGGFRLPVPAAAGATTGRTPPARYVVTVPAAGGLLAGESPVLAVDAAPSTS
ncbi:MAG: hypothetical protein ACXVWV_05130 [Nocardioides sp.]